MHGSNASLHTWESLAEELQDGYRPISHDQPGHELTGPHPRDDYTAQGLFEAIASFDERIPDSHLVLLEDVGHITME